jgi:translation initiation factor 2A
MWNTTGTALLVLSYADFDATNQSYYGGYGGMAGGAYA